MAAGNVNYDQLLTTTLSHHMKNMVDNVFKARVATWYLQDKNKVKMLSGGNDIVQELMYGKGHAASYGEFDAITISHQTGITSAVYPWRLLQADVAISGLQELKNSGPEQILDLLDAKVTQAEETLQDSLNTMLFADGTGNSSKDFMGFQGALRKGEAGDTTFGGIDATDALNSWWRSDVQDYTTVAGVNLRKEFIHHINTTSKGADRTDGIITTQTVFEAFEEQQMPNVRFSNGDAVNAGFTNLLVMNTPLYWDFATPAGVAFGLNSKYIWLYGHKNRWFKHTPFQGGMNVTGGTGAGTWVDARYALILCAGNLAVSNRSRQFKLINLGMGAGGSFA